MRPCAPRRSVTNHENGARFGMCCLVLGLGLASSLTHQYRSAGSDDRVSAPASGYCVTTISKCQLVASLRALPANDINRAIFGIALAAIISLVVFRLAQPYAFTDSALAKEQVLREQRRRNRASWSTAVRSVVGLNSMWVANMEEIQRLQAPEASFPPALQWTDRTPLLFPLTNMVLYGMGLTAGIAAFLGLFWALWRIVRFRTDWMNHAIPVIWSLGYFLFMGTRWVKSIRYFLPIYPTMLLSGRLGIVHHLGSSPASRIHARHSNNSARQD